MRRSTPRIADAPEHVFFLSDEAYIEYVEDERMWSSLPWIAKKRTQILQDGLISAVFRRVDAPGG